MHATQVTVVALLCLLISFGRTSASKQENQRSQQQEEEVLTSRQEEVADPYEVEEVGRNSFYITFTASSLQDEPVADILWMKKAAELALEVGRPYFDVKNQRTTKHYDRELDAELSTVEGTVKLTKDPMKGTYDALEITSLVLPEYED